MLDLPGQEKTDKNGRKLGTKKSDWTDEELELLRNYVSANRAGNWKEIAKTLGRSTKSVQSAWARLNARTGGWEGQLPKINSAKIKYTPRSKRRRTNRRKTGNKRRRTNRRKTGNKRRRTNRRKTVNKRRRRTNRRTRSKRRH